MVEQAIGPFDLNRVTIRPACEADYPSLRHLFTEGLLEGQVRDNDTGADIENLQDAYFSDDGKSGFWIAEYDGKIVGMVGVQCTTDDSAEIRRLRVHQQHRRQGIGTKLMEQALSFCRHHSYLKVVLDVRIERGPAIQMFEKFGFVVSRTRDLDGRKIIDFYLDLYREPDL